MPRAAMRAIHARKPACTYLLGCGGRVQAGLQHRAGVQVQRAEAHLPLSKLLLDDLPLDGDAQRALRTSARMRAAASGAERARTQACDFACAAGMRVRGACVFRRLGRINSPIACSESYVIHRGCCHLHGPSASSRLIMTHCTDDALMSRCSCACEMQACMYACMYFYVCAHKAPASFALKAESQRVQLQVH